jgi:DNA mismatch repair protein MutS
MPRFLEEEVGVGGPRMGGAARTFRDDWLFDATLAREELLRVFGVHSLDGFGFQAEDEVLVRAAGGLIAYVQEVRPTGVEHLRPPRIERSGAAMLLDDMTRRNLELVESLRPGEEGGTLLAVLDDTTTAMGGRALRRWLLRPLVQAQSIWERQESVAELFDSPELRGELRSRLREMSDLERISARLRPLWRREA